MSEIDRLREMIDGSKRIVAFTGAGISTESGIPDFRSPGGIWTKYQPIYFDGFMSSEEMRREAWRRKFATDETMVKAEPNAGHRALAKLVERGKMTAIITQNIDGLHQRAGISKDLVIEVHGNLHKAVCLSCGWRGPMQDVLERVRRSAVCLTLGFHHHELARQGIRSRHPHHEPRVHGAVAGCVRYA